jgi:hypothetical protein
MRVMGTRSSIQKYIVRSPTACRRAKTNLASAPHAVYISDPEYSQPAQARRIAIQTNYRLKTYSPFLLSISPGCAIRLPSALTDLVAEVRNLVGEIDSRFFTAGRSE